MNIYCDSDTLFHNIERHQDDPKAKKELDALSGLLALREQGKSVMFRSHLVTYEAMNTKDENHRARLISDNNALEPISKDEKLLGFNIQISQYVCINSPIISDVQDEHSARSSWTITSTNATLNTSLKLFAMIATCSLHAMNGLSKTAIGSKTGLPS